MEEVPGSNPDRRREELRESLALAERAADQLAGRFAEPVWFCVLSGLLSGVGVTLLYLDGAGVVGSVVVGLFIVMVSIRAGWRARRVRDRPPLSRGRDYLWWGGAMLLLLGPVPMLTPVAEPLWVGVKMLLLSAAFTLIYFRMNRAALRQSVTEGWSDDTF